MKLTWRSPPVLLMGLTLAGVAGFALTHLLVRRSDRRAQALS